MVGLLGDSCLVECHCFLSVLRTSLGLSGKCSLSCTLYWLWGSLNVHIFWVIQNSSSWGITSAIGEWVCKEMWTWILHVSPLLMFIIHCLCFDEGMFNKLRRWIEIQLKNPKQQEQSIKSSPLWLHRSHTREANPITLLDSKLWGHIGQVE